MTLFSDQTLASIVSQSFRAARVFEKYHLDFCCKGKRSLAEACQQQNISLEMVEDELNEVVQPFAAIGDQLFTEMSLTQLIGYIILKHHFYVKQAMPIIYQHIEKVAHKHGDNFPYMKEVLMKFEELKLDMEAHMKKEEEILFPRIQYMDKLTAVERNEISVIAASIDGPIAMMEQEHDIAGELMEEIRLLTSDFTPPESACTTFKLCLAELKEFEEDLHRHVYLENHLLFPKAKLMAGG